MWQLSLPLWQKVVSAEGSGLRGGARDTYSARAQPKPGGLCMLQGPTCPFAVVVWLNQFELDFCHLQAHVP